MAARAVCLLVALATAVIAAPAHAQTFPDRPIRLIVPAGPGGPTDLPARLVSQILPKLGQPAVVENRAGAGGAVGARAVMTASPDFTSVRELVAHAKAHPGKLNIAHTGSGGLPHLTVELFKSLAGIDIVGVPYKSGGEAVTGVLAGQVDMTFEGITILLPLIRDGRLRALAVTSRTRTSLAPDLPTMSEAGVADYE